ncbi:high-affinity branched-chain amino acid transporter permease LivH [Klebsiella pneumoniae]|nr:high-affinity branched-chain amino acid transporter permease LivH [Klebsiella pneumoniae]
MYALIAIGYTMVYGVLRLINFAHADVMMVGAFSTLFLFSSVGLPFGVAVFLTLGLCGLFGMLIDRVAYRPLRQASKISMLITAIGVSFFLENLFNVLFGGSSRFFSAPDFFNPDPGLRQRHHYQRGVDCAADHRPAAAGDPLAAVPHPLWDGDPRGGL